MKRTLVLLIVGAVAALTAGSSAGAAGKSSAKGVKPAAASPDKADGLKKSGVGIYTDDSTAHQLSTFTINDGLVSCGVGTVGAHDFTGPFAMLMYSSKINSYKTSGNTITATGRMRSITKTANTVTEDVMHDFRAIAVHNATGHGERFDVHFKTPFWNSSNPMCTASNVVKGGCRFGGELLMGNIKV